jgi:hypothetical protein
MTLILLGSISFSQVNSEVPIESRKVDSKKGNFFFYWGYNRTNYSKSDIHLRGKGYDFTLSEVRAKDIPKEFSADYFKPSLITIPQFNIRFGYQFNEHYTIASGWDHMKYRTTSGRGAIIDGYIRNSASEKYQGIYKNEGILMNDDELVKMEHSDGFNVININLERNDEIFSTNKKTFELSAVNGLGSGIALPWTNSSVFGKTNDDRPHFSGLGAHFLVAFQGTFYQHIFLRYTVQGGFQNMWDIAISPRGDNSAYAQQTIFYLQRSVVIGYQFKLFNR